MLWNVDDNGHMLVRLRSEGAGVSMLTKDSVNRYVANIVGDLSETMGVEVDTRELRISFSTTRPEINVTWRARVPAAQAGILRTYLTRMTSVAPGQ